MPERENRNSQEEFLTLSAKAPEPAFRERVVSLLRRWKRRDPSARTAGALEFWLPFVLMGAFAFIAFCPEHDFSVKVLPAVHVEDASGREAERPFHQEGVPPEKSAGFHPHYTVFEPGEIRAFCNQGGPELWPQVADGAKIQQKAGTGVSPATVLTPEYGAESGKKFSFGEDGSPGEQDIREEIRLAQLQMEAGHVDSALGDLGRLRHYADMPGFPSDLRLDILVVVMDACRLRLLSDGVSAAQDLRRACSAVIDAMPQSPSAAEALRNLSLASQTVGDFSGALDYLAAACERFPGLGGTDRSFLNLGTAASAAGKQEEAVRAFAELVRRYPLSALVPDAWAGAARSWSAQGRYDEAGKAFARLSDSQEYFLKAPDVLLEWARNGYRAEGVRASGQIAEIYRRFSSLELQGEQADEVLLGFGDLMSEAGMDREAQTVWHRVSQGSRGCAGTARMRLAEGRVIELPRDAGMLKAVFEGPSQKKLLELYRTNIASCPGTPLAEACRVREICLLSAQGFVHESRIRAVDFLRSSGKSDCAGLVAECLRGDLKRELAFIELPRDYIRLASAWQDTPEIREACGTPDPDLRAALGRGFMLMGKGAEAAAVLEPLLENRAMGEHGLYALSCCYNEALHGKDWKKLLHIADCVAAWPLPEGISSHLAYSSAIAYQALGNSVRALSVWRTVCEDETAAAWQRAYASWYLACDASRKKDSKNAYALYSRTVSFFEAAARQGSGHVDNSLLTSARRRLAEICEKDGRKREALAWLAQIPQKETLAASVPPQPRRNPASGSETAGAEREESAPAPFPGRDLISSVSK